MQCFLVSTSVLHAAALSRGENTRIALNATFTEVD